MKKKIAALLVCIVAFMPFSSCGLAEDRVAASLGKYTKYEFYTYGGFQDYTDYAKYYYESAKILDSKYLYKIQEADLATIDRHLNDFEEWIETMGKSDPSREIVVNYDFDREIINTGDYFYIESEESTWPDGYTMLVNYDVYLFDTETQVLYFFHNNI